MNTDFVGTVLIVTSFVPKCGAEENNQVLVDEKDMSWYGLVMISIYQY